MKKKTSRVTDLFLLTLFCWSTTLFAAPETTGQGDAFGENVDVRVVNVEVWVTDDEGFPITGLSPEDFEILEDGVPVEARFFQEIGNESSGAAAASTTSGATQETSSKTSEGQRAEKGDPGHLLIYADELHLGILTRQRLIRELRTFLAEENFPAERIMIVRQGRGLSSEAFFGSSRKEIDAALEELLDGKGAGELRADQERRLTIDRIQQYWEQASLRSTGPNTGGPQGAVGGPGTGFSAASAAIDSCIRFTQQAVTEVELYADRSLDRTAATLSGLTEVATFLAGIEGVKTVLYLGDSLERMPGSSLMTYVESLCATGDPQSRVFAVTEEIATAFKTLTRHANSNRVTIHAFQSEGLSPNTDLSASRRAVNNQSERLLDTARRQSARDGLGYLAEQTGGEAFLQKNTFDGSLAAVSRSMSQYYSLGYAPPHGGDGQEHRIEVRLREGIEGRIRHRQGYVDKDPLQRVTENLHTAMLLGVGENPLEIRLGAGDIAEVEGGFEVPLRVLVPVDKLVFLPQQKGDMAMLTVQVLARGPGAEHPELFTKSFRIPRPDDAAAELFSLPIDLQLSSGVQTVAVGLRDGASRETSYVSTSLKLGEGP